MTGERVPTAPPRRPVSAGQPEAPTQDWAARDLRDPDAAERQATYREVPASERARHAATNEDHFFDADEHMTMGEEEEVELRKARVSWLSVLGLVLGVIGILTALTGELAPIALAAGVIGLLLSIGGFVATGRPYVASRPLALLALLASLGALVLAVLAMTGQFDWLNRGDQAGWLRDWLNERVPGLNRW